MGTHRLYEMKQFHRLDMPEAYERLKVTALNLWEASFFLLTDRFRKAVRPTTSPFLKVGFFHIATQSQ
jgi:hypothetical protein